MPELHPPSAGRPPRAPRWAWAVLILWALGSVGGLVFFEYQGALRGFICMPRR